MSHKIINSPLNGPMATMEDIVAQFIDRVPVIYNEYIGGDDATGYYMKPDELSYTPNYYEITHSADIPLSVTLYKKAIFDDETNIYAKPPVDFTNGTVYKFNGKPGQFPKLKIKENPSMNYKTYNLVRICDIEAEFEVKKVNLILENLAFAPTVGFPFKSDNIEFVSKKATNREVNYTFDLKSDTYLYFTIKAEQWFDKYYEYIDYTLRIYVGGKLITVEKLKFGQTYEIFDISKDVEIKISGTKRNLQSLTVETVDEGKGLLRVERIDADGKTIRIIEPPVASGSCMLSYSDYSRTDNTFSIKMHVSDPTLSNIDYFQWQLRVKRDSATSDLSYVYNPNTKAVSSNPAADSWSAEIYVLDPANPSDIIIKEIPSTYAAYIFQIKAIKKYNPVTFEIIGDKPATDLYQSVKLWGKAASVGTVTDGRCVYKYTTVKSDYESWKNNKSIPWSLQLNLNSEALKDFKGVVSGIKVFEGKYNSFTAQEISIQGMTGKVLSLSGTMTDVTRFNDGKQIYLQLLSSVISILLNRVLTPDAAPQIKSVIKDSYVFKGNETQKIDYTTSSSPDSVTYSLYVKIPTNQIDSKFTKLNYKWYHKDGLSWVLDKSEERELYGDNKLTWIDCHKDDSYLDDNGDKVIYSGSGGPVSGYKDAYWPNLTFSNLEVLGDISYRLDVGVDIEYVEKEVIIKIPKFGEVYQPITIVNNYINLSGVNREFTVDATSDSDYYIYSYSGISQDDANTGGFSCLMDFFSKTPKYFDSIYYEAVEESEIGNYTTQSSNLYDLSNLRKNVDFNFRPDSSKITYTFYATRCTTRRPIYVVNDQPNIEIWDDERETLITDTVVEWDPKNPLIVMTYHNSGNFRFRIESQTDEIGSITYSEAPDNDLNAKTLTLENKVGVVSYSKYLGWSKEYFHVCGGGASIRIFVEQIKYNEGNNCAITLKNGSTDVILLSRDLEKSGEVSKTSDGQNIFTQISPGATEYVFSNINYDLEGSGQMDMQMTLYSCNSLISNSEFGSATWKQQSVKDLSPYNWVYGKAFTGENVTDIENIKSWKLTFYIQNSTLKFFGWVSPDNIVSDIRNNNVLMTVPIEKSAEYYCIVSTASVDLRADQIEVKELGGTWYQIGDIKDLSLTIGNRRYFSIQVKNRLSAWDGTGGDHMIPYSGKNQDFFTAYALGLGTPVFGMLPEMVKYGYSEFTTSFGSADNVFKNNVKLYIPSYDPNYSEYFRYAMEPNNDCLWIYFQDYIRKIEGGVEYLYDRYKVSDFKLISETGRDVTSDFDIELFYLDRSLVSGLLNDKYSNGLVQESEVGSMIRIKFKQPTSAATHPTTTYTLKLGDWKNLTLHFSYTEIFRVGIQNETSEFKSSNGVIIAYSDWVASTDIADMTKLPSGFYPASTTPNKNPLTTGYPVLYKNNTDALAIPSKYSFTNTRMVMFPVDNNTEILYKDGDDIKKMKLDDTGGRDVILEYKSYVPTNMNSTKWTRANTYAGAYNGAGSTATTTNMGMFGYVCGYYNSVNSPFFITNEYCIGLCKFDLYVTYHVDSSDKIDYEQTEIVIKNFRRINTAGPEVYQYRDSDMGGIMRLYENGSNWWTCEPGGAAKNTNSIEMGDISWKKDKSYSCFWYVIMGNGRESNLQISDFVNIINAHFENPCMVKYPSYSELNKEYKAPMFSWCRYTSNSWVGNPKMHLHLWYNLIEKRVKD